MMTPEEQEQLDSAERFMKSVALSTNGEGVYNIDFDIHVVLELKKNYMDKYRKPKDELFEKCAELFRLRSFDTLTRESKLEAFFFKAKELGILTHALDEFKSCFINLGYSVQADYDRIKAKYSGGK